MEDTAILLQRTLLKRSESSPLDESCCVREAFAIMKISLFPAAAVLALSLSACQQSQPETLDTTASDPQAEALAKSGPVVLPPAVKASVTFRCKDNSLVYVDFFSGDKQAQVRQKKDGEMVMLKSEKAGDPMIADGYSMTGDPKSITLKVPGKDSLTCKT